MDSPLADLGLDYVDLYLIPRPVTFDPKPSKLSPLDGQGLSRLPDTSVSTTWIAMESLVAMNSPGST